MDASVVIVRVVAQTGNPDKRHGGAVGYIGLLTMLGLSMEVAYRLLTSSD